MTRETPYAASIGGGEDEYPQEDPDPQTLDIRGSLTSPFETLSDRLTFPEEEARLLALGRGEPGEPVTGTVLDRFAATVAGARHGEPAVTAPDGTLTFAELDARARHVAALTASAGVVPGDRVAVLLPRSTDSVAALLGVLTAGAVHVPLDPALPEARLAAVLADANRRRI